MGRILSLLLVLLALGNAGCGSAGKTAGWVLAGTGGLMTATGVVLATGCTSPSPTDPNVSTKGPCMPQETWESAKPAVVTGIVAGIILLAGGVAILASQAELKPSAAQSSGTQDPPKPPPTTETCTGSDICY